MAEIKGMPQLLRKLDDLASLNGAKRGLAAGALHIKGIVSQYPPATEANSSTMDRWYQRGYGPRWRRRDGTIGGRKTSEALGRKWATESRNAGLTQVIGNNTSYGPWVQAAEKAGGKGPQASFHRQRGWKTDEDVINQEGATVLAFVKREVEKDID